MKHTIPCETCGGSGRQELWPALIETLNTIPKRGAVVAADIFPKIKGVQLTAINNRLEGLRRYGFVKRERCGKFWRYSRA